MVNRTNSANNSANQHGSKPKLGTSSAQSSSHRTSQGGNNSTEKSHLSALAKQLPGVTEQVQTSKNTSLRWRLLQTILPTVLVPLAVVNAIGYSVLKQRADNSVSQQLKDQALLASEGTTDVLTKAIQTPETIATNPLVISAARDANQRAKANNFEELSIEQLEQRFNSDKLLQVDRSLNQYLQRAASTTGIAELIVTERQGLNIAASNQPSDLVQRDEKWWQQAKSLTQSISDPEFDQSANTFSVDVSQAILDPESKEFLGVIKAVLPANTFTQVSDYLERAGIRGSQQVQLLSSNKGSVIATIGAKGSIDAQEALGGKAIQETAVALVAALKSKQDPEQALSAAKTKHSLSNLTFTPLKSGNDQVLAASFVYKDKRYTLATIPKTNWVAISSIDRADIAATSNELLLIFALSFILLSAAAIAVITYLSRQLSAPLRYLSGAAEEVASGNLEVPLIPCGTVETQALAQTLENLVSRVKGFLQEQAIALDQANLLTKITSVNTVTNQHVEQVFNQALSEARQMLGVDRIVVYRFKSNWGGYISYESVASGWVQALNDQIEDSCIPQSLLEAYKNGRVVPTNDVFNAGFHPNHLKLMERLQVKANLVVPILHEGNLFGLLIAHHCASTHAWRETEINFMRQLAAQLGVTLDRVTFIQDRETQAERAHFLREITLQITEAETSEALLAQLPVAKIRYLLQTDRVIIYRFDENWKGTITAESVADGFPRTLGAEIYDPCFAGDYVDKYKRGRIQAISNIFEAGLTTCHLNQLEPFAVKANLVAPILQGDKLLGLLIAHECSGPRNWEQTEIDLFAQVASQIGLALDRSSLLDEREAAAQQAHLLAAEQQRQAEKAHLLREITLQITEADTPEAILAQLPVANIRYLLEADRVIIYRFDENWKGTITAESVADGFPRAFGVQIYDPCFAENYVDKYKQGRIQAISNIFEAGLTTCHLNQLEPFAVKANLVAPVLQSGRLLGLLIAHQCSGPRNWEQTEIDLFAQVASQIGLALDRSSLLDEREAAAQQARLLAAEQQRQKEVLQHQLASLLGQVEEAARGDLTVRADVTDGEIGTVADFFNSIIENLRQIVTQVKQSAIRVSDAVGEDEEAIRQLANTAFKQAEETARTLQSVEHMTQSIQAVAENAHQAAIVADTASATAAAGGAAIDRTVQSIQSLRELIDDTSKKMKRLGESSQQISKVAALIEKIALQTNLLSINAGIEAARAGQEGQGFAVVAEEIGELAAKSAAATKEVEEIVATIQMETSQVADAMEKSTAKVVEGTQLVEVAKQSLSQILDVSQQIDQLVKSISEATSSQTQTSQVVTNLMKEVVQVSQQTSDSSRRVSNSLQQTVEIAQELQASVRAFKVEENGSSLKRLLEQKLQQI